LIKIKSLNNFIFIIISEIYCTYVKNKIKKISVYNVSENISKCSTMYIRSMLLKEMIIITQKIHLNEIHFLKNKFFLLKFQSSNETYCTCVINEVKKMFIYNVSENNKKCSTMHVRSILLKVIIIAMQKMHLNKIYCLKNKIS